MLFGGCFLACNHSGCLTQCLDGMGCSTNARRCIAMSQAERQHDKLLGDGLQWLCGSIALCHGMSKE